MAKRQHHVVPDQRVKKSPPRILPKPLPVVEALKKVDAIPEVPGKLNPPTQGSCGSMGHSKHRHAPRSGHRGRG